MRPRVWRLLVDIVLQTGNKPAVVQLNLYRLYNVSCMYHTASLGVQCNNKKEISHQWIGVL